MLRAVSVRIVPECCLKDGGNLENAGLRGRKKGKKNEEEVRQRNGVRMEDDKLSKRQPIPLPRRPSGREGTVKVLRARFSGRQAAEGALQVTPRCPVSQALPLSYFRPLTAKTARGERGVPSHPVHRDEHKWHLNLADWQTRLLTPRCAGDLSGKDHSGRACNQHRTTHHSSD